MNVFWQPAPLSSQQSSLLSAVLCAHQQSVFRDNVSSAAVRLAISGSGDYGKALAAALMTIGGRHAPLAQTTALLQVSDIRTRALEIMAGKEKVPGWGNSFAKEHKDPLWLPVEGILEAQFPDLAKKLSDCTETLHQMGKRIHPNPSAYTAAAGLALGMPVGVVPWLFVAGRLNGWSALML